MKKIIASLLAVLTFIVPAFAIDTVSVTEPEIDIVTDSLLKPIGSVAIGNVLTVEEVQSAVETYKKKLAEEEAKRKAEEAAQEAIRREQTRLQYVSSQKYSYNVWNISGLSVSEFNKLLAPYALAGNGQAFYDMEHTYGVNGIFAMAIANTETSLGGYGPSRRSHSYFGIIGKKYSSDYEGIMGFGKYLKTSGYYTGKSIDGIAVIYCPPMSGSWAASNKQMMNTLWSRV